MSRDRRLDSLNRSRGAEFWTEAPPRWMTCPSVGHVIEDRFLPFKTPLDHTYDSKVPEPNRFGVEDVYAAAKNLKKEITVWIDLSKTNRFYQKDEVESRGTTYRKVPCGGHGECPSQDQTNIFSDTCERFYKESPNAVIGIHCTHGFNRTGFMICAFLVERDSWSLEAALKAFAKARPPGIYKEDYLKELYRRYDDPEIDVIAPDLPAWCYDEQNADLDDEGNNLQPEDQANDGGPSDRTVSNSTNSQFMEGVPNVAVVTDHDLVVEIQTRCKKLCGWHGGGFPGAQPVSMGLDNLHLIHDAPYYVSWKADGVRYMLFVDGEDRVFFLDRNNCVFKVTGMSFPSRVGSSQLKNTLMDGEMIIDTVPAEKDEDGEIVKAAVLRPRYLIYDIVQIMDFAAGQKRFDKRCAYIQNEVIEPRNREVAAGRLDKDQEPFSIRWKQFCPLVVTDKTKGPQSMAEKFLGPKFSEILSHEVDGLVFQPVSDPYIAGRCDAVLKWKPPHQCTVDFKLRIVKEGGFGMIPKMKGLLFVSGRDAPFGELAWKQGMHELRKYENKILECKFDLKSRRWELMRERTDKTFPNAFSTADSVFKGIIHPLTQDILFKFIRERSYVEAPHNSKLREGKCPNEDAHHQPSRPPPPPPVRYGRTDIAHDPSAPKIF